VELKTLQTPEEERVLHRVLVRRLELEQKLAPRGTLNVAYEPMLATEVMQRFDEIESAARTLVSLGQPHAVIEGLCTIRFSPEPRADGTVISPAPRTDVGREPHESRDVRAIRRLVNENVAKFDGYGPAVLVARTHQHLSLDWRAMPFAAEDTAEAIAVVLSERPQVSAVLVIEPRLTWEGLGAWTDAAPGWIAWSRPDRHQDFHGGMLVLNPNASNPLTDEEVKRLILIGTAL
jgi:hypothetical protein